MYRKDEKHDSIYWISVHGNDFPFDFSMRTIYQFCESVGWKKETLDSIISRLTAAPTLGDHIDLYHLAMIRAQHKLTWDATKQGKLDKDDLLDAYYILFKALVDSIEVFFARNGILDKAGTADRDEGKK